MSSVTNESSHERITQASDDVVDRISNMPESVISHILSLLPTEDAVATCLLSTRWKFHWRKIHNLCFKDSARHFTQPHHTKHEQNSLFADFVNKVLLSLDQKCIDKFVLEVKQFSDVHSVTNWITAAVSLNAKVIKFIGDLPEKRVRFHMPSDLFTCKTLEVLHLVGLINLNVPNLVSLPNLISLTLQNVVYGSDESVTRLIMGCSSLEELNVMREAYDNVVNFTVFSPTLRSITLVFFEGVNRFPTEFYYKLMINAPQLRDLLLLDTFLDDYSLKNSYLLEKAHIDLSTGKSYIQDDQYTKAVVKFVQGLYNVKDLSLNGKVVEILNHAKFAPSFPRLSQLTMESNCWSCPKHSLLNFVEGFTRLEFLEVSKNSSYKTMQAKSWRKPEKVPSCFLSLKTVALSDVVDEVEMIAYILKNAKALTKMTIQLDYDLDTEVKLQFVQKVTNFPRGSEECELNIVDPSSRFFED